jgi:hypothetical protein
MLYLCRESNVFYPYECRQRAGPNRIGPLPFIQNAKLGFYVKKDNIIVEYYLEQEQGFYVNKFLHGNQSHAIPMNNAESFKFCQCSEALDMNTASYELGYSHGQPLNSYRMNNLNGYVVEQ